jgi:ABC-type lipoprotein release transport system permease subunit
MESLLYGVKSGDPVIFFGVSAILLMVALLAVLIPARRAISLDPVAALRSE